MESELVLQGSCVFALVGTVFMLTCKKMWKHIYKANLKTFGVEKKESDGELERLFGGLVSHCCFVLGFILFALGMVGIGLSLHLTPSLAMMAAIQGPMSQLLFMAMLRKSPTGHPDVPGPPLVPKVILSVVECVSIYGTYQNIQAGVYDPELLKTFQILVLIAIGVPSAIGFFHRNAKSKSA